MGEFVVYKDMQRSRTPPCPDLAEAHPEVRAIAPPTVAAVRSAAPPGLPKKTQSVLAPRPVIVSQNAFIRKEPSGPAQYCVDRQRRRETDRLLYAVRLDAGRKSESERMDRRRAAAAVIQRLFCAQQDSLSYGIRDRPTAQITKRCMLPPTRAIAPIKRSRDIPGQEQTCCGNFAIGIKLSDSQRGQRRDTESRAKLQEHKRRRCRERRSRGERAIKHTTFTY